MVGLNSPIGRQLGLYIGENMSLPGKQRGLTALGWLVLVLVVGGTTSIGVKLVPHYMDFNTAVRLLEGMTREPGVIHSRTADLRANFQRRLKVNNIYKFDLKERLKIKRVNGRMNFDLDYEVREPITTNINILITFKHNIELKE
jgi:hypothetical protein